MHSILSFGQVLRQQWHSVGWSNSGKERGVTATRHFKSPYLQVIQLEGRHLLWKHQCRVMIFFMDKAICIMWCKITSGKTLHMTSVMPSRYPRVGQVVPCGRCQWLGQWCCALQTVWSSCTVGSAWISLFKKGGKKIGQIKIRKIEWFWSVCLLGDGRRTETEHNAKTQLPSAHEHLLKISSSKLPMNWPATQRTQQTDVFREVCAYSV